MNKIRLLYIVVSVLLCFGMGVRADNIITLSSAEGLPDEEVMISIGLQNSDDVSSLQVSIPLGDNVSLVESSGQIGERCAAHSLTVGVKDGVLNVFVYSMSMAAIAGNSGVVASFRLKLGSQPSTTVLTSTKTVLTNSSGATVPGTVLGGTVTTRCAKAQYSTMTVDFGEVPIRSTYTKTVTVKNVGNAVLTITDMEFSDVNVFSTTTTFPVAVAAGASKTLNITYAPVERGSITRTVKVVCNSISKLNTIELKAKPFAVNELHVQPVTGISDEEVTVRMTMNNMDDISGYQVEFDLPSQLEYVDGSFALSSRKQDHVALASLNDNKLRLIVYSGNDLPLTGNDGEIGSFRVKLVGRNSVKLTPSKTVLSATINNKIENVVSAVYGGQITIRRPIINTSGSLNFGAVPVTQVCEKSFNIRNTGNAPLTVSRIVFTNEHLSIKEAFPIEISAGGSRSVTVVYNSIEETAFSGTMQIYSNDPDLRLREVTITGSRFAPNYLTFATPDVYSDENMRIEVSADTYDDISALQFDVVYPSAQYKAFDGDYILESRAGGMTVTSRQIDETTLRFFCYFFGNSYIEAGSGKLMTIKLKPKNNVVVVGSYTVSIKNIKLGTSEMTDKYAGTNMQTSFRVEERPAGDVNLDGLVDSGDVMAVYSAMAGNADTDTQMRADVNGDGLVNSGDVMAIYSIMAGN